MSSTLEGLVTLKCLRLKFFINKCSYFKAITVFIVLSTNRKQFDLYSFRKLWYISSDFVDCRAAVPCTALRMTYKRKNWHNFAGSVADVYWNIIRMYRTFHHIIHFQQRLKPCKCGAFGSKQCDQLKCFRTAHSRNLDCFRNTGPVSKGHWHTSVQTIECSGNSAFLRRSTSTSHVHYCCRIIAGRKCRFF